MFLKLLNQDQSLWDEVHSSAILFKTVPFKSALQFCPTEPKK